MSDLEANFTISKLTMGILQVAKMEEERRQKEQERQQKY